MRGLHGDEGVVRPETATALSSGGVNPCPQTAGQPFAGWRAWVKGARAGGECSHVAEVMAAADTTTYPETLFLRQLLIVYEHFGTSGLEDLALGALRLVVVVGCQCHELTELPRLHSVL